MLVDALVGCAAALAIVSMIVVSVLDAREELRADRRRRVELLERELFPEWFEDEVRWGPGVVIEVDGLASADVDADGLIRPGRR